MEIHNVCYGVVPENIHTPTGGFFSHERANATGGLLRLLVPRVGKQYLLACLSEVVCNGRLRLEKRILKFRLI